MKSKKRNKIKILFTIPNFDTAGSGKHMVDLIKLLDPGKFESHICVEHTKGELFKIVEKLGYKIHVRSLAPNRGSYPSALLNAIKNAKFFRREGFDLVHSFHWKSDWFEPFAARIAGVPWTYTKKSMTWGKHWRFRTLLARFVFTLNPDMVELYPISRARSQCVGLGPDVNSIIFKVSQYNRERIKSDFGLENKTIVLTMASVIPVKNIDCLIKSISKLKLDTDLHFLIVGGNTGDYADGVAKLIHDSGLSEKVTLTGKVMDVEKYIAVADLYVQPSLSEASGVACMEACAAGIPSICSNVPGLKFVVGNSKLLFDVDSVSALTNKMEWYFGLKKQDQDEIAKQLQQRMFDVFHLPVVAKDHESVYLKILEKS